MNIDYCGLVNGLGSIKIQKKPKTFLQIVEKPFDEGLISKLVAYFLDEHNINKKVLNPVLAKVQNGEDNFVELLEDGELISVKTEDPISTDSRLDIIIKYSNFWLVIENKARAHESKENQTMIYEKHINKINVDNLPVKYIYLKPNFNKSKPSNEKFSIILYSDLINIFKSIKEDDLIEKEDYYFLQDFIKHSEAFLMKDNEIDFDESAVQFYLNNREKIDYLVENYKNQCANIRNTLAESLRERFPDFLVHDTNSYIQIFKANWENVGSRGIHFEMTPYPKFDNIIGNKEVKFNFTIHNEDNTKYKYTNIKQQRYLYKKSYNFNNPENIQKAFSSILETMQLIIDEYAGFIDEEIRKYNAQ